MENWPRRLTDGQFGPNGQQIGQCSEPCVVRIGISSARLSKVPHKSTALYGERPKIYGRKSRRDGMAQREGHTRDQMSLGVRSLAFGF